MQIRTEAEACFRPVHDVAVRQKVMPWQLRAAMSLAKFDQSLGKPGEARKKYSSQFDEFTEGFQITDLIAAASVLSQL